ncbi:MAG TPA: hypothetical protein VFO22_00375 [Candidatus Udaeobacter sp.]|nr:hypothetical protein [Candidatus Udaeobacter sp.]
MALLRFSPKFASIVERKESILSEESLKLRVFMKSIFLVAALVVCAGGFAQQTHPGGIVYGPKAAFKIDAPPGWVLDNSAGAEQGLPCVLYPKGSTWADANAIMYAKIAGTDYEDVGKFVAMAIQQMEKAHGKPKEKVDSGKTGDGQPYFINEYPATESYSQWERVAYIQLSKAVAYIVFSARDEASYRKNFPALNEVLKSFAYMKVEGDHKQH